MAGLVRRVALRRRRKPRWRPPPAGLAFWRKRRRQLYRRDGGVCRRCQGAATDAAHVVGLGMGSSRYDEDDPRNRLSNLVSLCRPCHVGRDLGEWAWEEIGVRPSPALLRYGLATAA